MSLEFVARLLRDGVEDADGCDLVAVEFDADGIVAVEREKVNDAAAMRHVAAFVDLIPPDCSRAR